MNTRALMRVLLSTGLLVLIGALVTVRVVETEERPMELFLIGALALGVFLTISGLVGVLTEAPAPEAFDEAAETAPRRPTRGPSIAAAMGAYLLLLALAAAVVVGVATRDVGAGLQTFTFGMILGGVVFGLGYLLGHRPVEEEQL